MKDTGSTVTLAQLDLPSQCRVQGLLSEQTAQPEIVESYDAREELAGAAFMIMAAFGGFVSLVVAICSTIARLVVVRFFGGFRKRKKFAASFENVIAAWKRSLILLSTQE